MQRFPILKTKNKELTLEPLGEKHRIFYTNLLNNPEIQKTLFRSPRKVSENAFMKAKEKMSLEPAKAITYILTLSQNNHKTAFGYVKVSIIDWTNKSCYLAIATLPNAEYRGKGYAKTTFEAFFDYLFSLGFLKIYGRTYLENIATEKLNFTTGFRFIGKQKHFIIYKQNKSQDALFFEKLHPKIDMSYSNKYSEDLLVIYRKITSTLQKEKTVSALERPINLKHEIHHWHKTKGSYIPKFEYNKPQIKAFSATYKKLITDVGLLESSLGKRVSSEWLQYVARVREYLSMRLKLVQSIGTTKWDDENKSFYLAEMPAAFIKQAKTLGKSVIEPKSRWSTQLTNENQLKEVCETAFGRLFGKEISVLISPRASVGSFAFLKKQVKISPTNHLASYRLMQVLIHEAVHAISHLNAYKSIHPLVSLGFTPGSLWMEEGLATYLTELLTSNEELPLGAVTSWNLKHFFETMDTRKLYDALRDVRFITDKSESTILLERFWRSQNGYFAGYTYKRLTYLPAYLFVKDLLLARSNAESPIIYSSDTTGLVSKLLGAPVAWTDYNLLFNQFLSNDFKYGLTDLFNLKMSTAELIEKVTKAAKK